MQKSLLAPALAGPDTDRDLGSPGAEGTKFPGQASRVAGLMHAF